MKALIVAAGKGNRLRPLTETIPNALIEIEGEPLINRSVRILQSNNIEEITVVVGYKHQKIRDILGNSVQYVINPDLSTTNNMASMEAGMELIGNNPFIYLHADIWYEPSIISLALKQKGPLSFLVDKKVCGEEEMKVRVVDGFITEADKSIAIEEAYGEWLGIAKFDSDGSKIYRKAIKQTLITQKQEYDCSVISDLVLKGLCVQCVPIGNRKWIEIDFIEDVIEAKRIASS